MMRTARFGGHQTSFAGGYNSDELNSVLLHNKTMEYDFTEDSNYSLISSSFGHTSGNYRMMRHHLINKDTKLLFLSYFFYKELLTKLRRILFVSVGAAVSLG